jgi:hypothetical protein
LLFCLLPTFTAVSVAEEQSGLFNYPVSLFNSGQYYRSISEIKRLEFYFPQKSQRHQLHLLLQKNYYKLGQHQKVQEVAKDIFLQNREQPLTKEKITAAKILTFSLLKSGAEDKAQLVWEERVSLKKDDNFPLSSNLENRLNPDLAKTYSYVLPGAGLLYAGSYGKATVSFLLNSLFLIGINQNIHSGHLGIATLLFFFEWGWYFGGARAAEEEVDNYNQKLSESKRQQWISKQSSQLCN